MKAAIADRFYRLIDLAQGGMARVSLAVNAQLKGVRKLVVVKQLLPEFAVHPAMRLQFLQEARLATKLSHPNLVQTLELCEDQNELFIVMEYLEGQTLAAVSEQGQLPLKLILALLCDVCRGLHHAHELCELDGTPLGVVHRDVSPQNVLVTYTGEVKVLDFGIAQTSGGTSSSVSCRAGKVRYMAPEQARGEALDRRADVFSVGVMLWEMLAGVRMWEGIETAAVLARVAEGLLPEFPRLDIEPELLAIVQRATAATPEERFGSALELQSALEQQLRDLGDFFGRGDIASYVGWAFAEEQSRDRRVVAEKVRRLEADWAAASSQVRIERIDAKSSPSSSSAGRYRVRPSPSPERRRAKPPLPNRTSSRPQEPCPMPAASTARATNPAVPPRWKMAEPYQLLRRLEEGKLLFIARNTNTNKLVCVQLLKGVQTQSEAVSLFRNAVKLRQSNTVRVLDLGVVEEPVRVAFVVREYVRGQSLAQVLKREGVLSLRRSLRLSVALLQSLSEAHAKGIIHGRLGPECLLLTESGLEGERTQVLGYWRPVGKKPGKRQLFQAPERSQRPTLQGDLYAAGALLFLCLFGRPPTRDVISGQLCQPSGGRPALWAVPGLHALLERALAPESATRFQSAQEMVKQLLELDWTAEGVDGELDQAQDRYGVGAMPVKPIPCYRPQGHALMSTRPVSIWVLDDDPVLNSPIVASAVAALASTCEIRRLGVAERELVISELSAGKCQPPWVLMYGSLNVILQEPLLDLLKTCGEMSRLLLGTQENLELLECAITTTGVEAYASLPCEPQSLVQMVNRLILRTQRLNQHYDGMRLALKRVHDQVSVHSRQLAANDTLVPQSGGRERAGVSDWAY